MEHSCKSCGTAVEDGRPFCPHCRAPQIHVSVSVPFPEIAGALNSPTDTSPGETLPSGRILGAHGTVGSGERGAVSRAALKAGVLGVLLAIIPFLGSVLTGALAVFFYRRRNPTLVPTALGWRLGGAAGVVAFAINALFLVVRIFIFHAQQEYIELLTRFAQSLSGNGADPAFQAAIRSLLTPSGMTLGLLFGMTIALVLGGIGGALAALVSRPSHPRL